MKKLQKQPLWALCRWRLANLGIHSKLKYPKASIIPAQQKHIKGIIMKHGEHPQDSEIETHVSRNQLCSRALVSINIVGESAKHTTIARQSSLSWNSSFKQRKGLSVVCFKIFETSCFSVTGSRYQKSNLYEMKKKKKQWKFKEFNSHKIELKH